jgi:opacity protein-like surface antigen
LRRQCNSFSFLADPGRAEQKGLQCPPRLPNFTSILVNGVNQTKDRNAMNSSKFSKILLASLVCTLAASRLPALDSGWKLGFDVGPTWVHDEDIVTTDQLFGGETMSKLQFKTGYRLDFDAGYQFCRYFTLDGELGYINNQVDVLSSDGNFSTSFNQIPLMVDGVFTLPFFGIVKPYAGAGLGVVYTGADDLSDINGAGQILAGLKVGLPAGVDVGLGYKLLITTEHDWGDVIFFTTEGTKSISQSLVAQVSIKF